MKIISIVGARPQFIKLAPIVREIQRHENLQHVIIHTGQHYDSNMSGNFFQELILPRPDYNLAIGSGTHAEQTGGVLQKLEKIFLEEKPDHVLIFGDTNATLSGALCAAKLNLPLSHVEAGLRSYNNLMPEEINRVISDRLATNLFCPDENSVNNLTREGIVKNVYNVGDVMVDQLYAVQSRLPKLTYDNPYVLLTLHRESISRHPHKLQQVLMQLDELSKTVEVIFPAHPRVQKLLQEMKVNLSPTVKVVEPVPYRQAIALIQQALCVITDSGGMQKEAYLLKTPCITLREETEWTDTLKNCWNTLVGLSPEKLKKAFADLLSFDKRSPHPDFYGSGEAASKIVEQMVENA